MLKFKFRTVGAIIEAIINAVFVSLDYMLVLNLLSVIHRFNDIKVALVTVWIIAVTVVIVIVNVWMYKNIYKPLSNLDKKGTLD